MKLGLSKVSIILIVFASILSLGAGYQIGHAVLPAASCNLALGTGSMKCIEFQMQDILFPDAVACPTYSATQSGLCQSTGGILTLNSGGKATTVDASGNFNLNNALTFPAIADSATAGKLFLSSTTANTLKYYDASSGLHSIATLDLVQTFTGTVTLNSLTLGGAVTGAGNNLNAIGNIAFNADNTQTLATATNRLASISSVLFNVFHASADANPSSQLGDGVLKFGVGGGTALDQSLSRQTLPLAVGGLWQPLTGNLIGNLGIAPSGTNTNGILSIFRTNSFATNYEELRLGSDLIGSTNFGLQITAAGTGAVRPFIVWSGTTEVFRITTAPNLQMNSISITGTYNIGGTPTFTASPALSSGTTLPSGGLMMFGGVSQNTIAAGTTTYCPVTGAQGDTTAGCSTTESKVQMVLPIKGVVKNLYVTLGSAPGVGTSWAVTIRNAGANSAVTCTIANAATTCSDTSNTATITKGNNIDIAFVPTGATGATWVQVSFEADQSG